MMACNFDPHICVKKIINFKQHWNFSSDMHQISLYRHTELHGSYDTQFHSLLRKKSSRFQKTVEEQNAFIMLLRLLLLLWYYVEFILYISRLQSID